MCHPLVVIERQYNSKQNEKKMSPIELFKASSCQTIVLCSHARSHPYRLCLRLFNQQPRNVFVNRKKIVERAEIIIGFGAYVKWTCVLHKHLLNALQADNFSVSASSSYSTVALLFLFLNLLLLRIPHTSTLLIRSPTISPRSFSRSSFVHFFILFDCSASAYWTLIEPLKFTVFISISCVL